MLCMRMGGDARFQAGNPGRAQVLVVQLTFGPFVMHPAHCRNTAEQGPSSSLFSRTGLMLRRLEAGKHTIHGGTPGFWLVIDGLVVYYLLLRNF